MFEKYVKRLSSLTKTIKSLNIKYTRNLEIFTERYKCVFNILIN